MMPRLSDVFGSDNNESNQSSSTNADQNADGSANASNDGVSVSNESYSRDEDGNESYESTGIDTGSTDLGGEGDLGSMVESMTDSASSSDNTELLDN
jgi:hypothetical protein